MGEQIRHRSDVGHARGSMCPGWCITTHGSLPGEEDWVHEGAEVAIVDGLTARLCMSVDPLTGAQDGPHVLIGSEELTLSAASELGSRLHALATAGAPYSDNSRKALSRSGTLSFRSTADT